MSRTKILGPDRTAEAAALLRAGELVVFPTETVYGLGARADDARAVNGIYEAKERPVDNPLIVHVHSLEAVDERIAKLDERARHLLARFAPGPLTVVVPRGTAIVDEVTAGLPTVGLRIPAHPVALAMLAEVGTGVAAPSANRSGRPSPTDLESAIEHMDGRVAAILDGGPCARGIESTVVRLVGRELEVLREGAISHEQIEEAFGIAPRAADEEDDVPASPGVRHPHYRPRAGVSLVSAEQLAELAPRLREDERAIALAPPGAGGDRVVVLEDLEAYAREFYRLLHRFDREGVTRIYCELPQERDLGRALLDRLRRAAAL